MRLPLPPLASTHLSLHSIEALPYLGQPAAAGAVRVSRGFFGAADEGATAHARRCLAFGVQAQAHCARAPRHPGPPSLPCSSPQPAIL